MTAPAIDRVLPVRDGGCQVCLPRCYNELGAPSGCAAMSGHVDDVGVAALSSALVGSASAIGALGGVLVNLGFRELPERRDPATRHTSSDRIG